jgi:hypothetical protein
LSVVSTTASSGAPVRASGSIRSSDQVASPVVRTCVNSGSMICQISASTMRAGWPSAPGCFLAPTIGTRLWL